MADRPGRRIDAHQHIWDLTTGAYAWPTAAESAIFRSFAPPDLAPELPRAGIDGTVLVQAADSLADTDAMVEARATNPWILGIVGWAPLDDADATARAIEPRLGQGCGASATSSITSPTPTGSSGPTSERAWHGSRRSGWHSTSWRYSRTTFDTCRGSPTSIPT